MTSGFRRGLLPGLWFAMILALPHGAQAADLADRSCLQALQGVHLQDHLRVTLTGGEVVEGRLFTLDSDTLGLVPGPSTAPDLRPRRLAAADITRLEIWKSGTGRGARWGATSGTFIGGALGGLLGWVLSGLESDETSSTGELILPAIAVGALSGAIVIGGLGAGIGALSSGWTALYPDDQTSPGIPSPSTRLVLHGGLAQNSDSHGHPPVWGTRLAVMKRLGNNVEFGPAVGYYHFERRTDISIPGGVYTTGTDPVTTVGLDLALDARKTGFAPYGLVGAGWYVSSDLFVGGMVGGGFRWQSKAGPAYHLDARYHRSLTGDISGGVSRFWIIGGGITFGF